MTMTSIRSEFKHRSNPDGTFDSFCLCCFLTIATTSSEDALTALESAHQCSGIFSFASNVVRFLPKLRLTRLVTSGPVAR